MATLLTYIVGSRHHEGAAERIRKLKADEELQLVREPKNPYDRNAVAVYSSDGQKLGYVPKEDAPMVARVIDGDKLHCTKARADGGTMLHILWEA